MMSRKCSIWLLLLLNVSYSVLSQTAVHSLPFINFGVANRSMPMTIAPNWQIPPDTGMPTQRVGGGTR
ncbi:MAG: hypothetical protein HC769_19425 [Cyanobacteria bacterium CRU_2_1]|nr:hypothetical protein [Cyanobacteria bacterium RU_5_0]NJR60799.1 hypothetical protein [Cyanobacteria bacterium CRU_2_1]